MPRLPSPEDFGTELPRGDRGFVQIAPDQGGKALQDFAGRVTRMAEEEAERLDRINVQDAMSELSEADTQLAFGEKGFLSNKQGATKDPNFAKPYQEQYQKQIEAIAAKIQKPRAREAFLAQAAGQRAQFNRGIVSHISRQVEEAQEVSSKLAVDALAKKLDFDPTRLGGALTDLDVVLQSEQEKFSKDSAGRRSFTLYKEGIQGGMVVRAAQSALAKDQFIVAEQILTEHGRLMGGDASKIHEQLKARKSFVTGSDLVPRAMALPKEERAEFLRKEAGADIEVYKVAEDLLRDREADEVVAVHEQVGELTRTFQTRPTRAEMQRVMKSPRFVALPAAVQAEQIRIMREEVESQDVKTRDSITRRWQEEALDPERIRLFGELATLDDLAAKTPAWLAEQRPKLGKLLYSDLVKAHTNAVNGVKSFKIPEQILMEGAPGVKKEEKRTLGAYKGAVERMKQQWMGLNPGKVPSPEDVNEWMQRATETYVLERSPSMSNWFGSDKKTPGYEIKAMPPDFVNSAQALRKKNRLKPLSEKGLWDLWVQQPGAHE